MRVTSDIWVSALLKRATSAGAFATIIHKGAREAGAIHVILNPLDGTHSLLGPAPQFLYEEQYDGERLFEFVLNEASEAEVQEKIKRERSFDPDIWVIEIEDRQGRSFIDTIVSA